MTQTVPTWTRGERMAKAREEAGLSQEQMAELLGVSDKAISSWETMKRQPRNMDRVLAQWAEITNVPLWWLYDVGTPQSRCITIPAGEGRLFDPTPYSFNPPISLRRRHDDAPVEYVAIPA
jgi:transcriptional regulator with XRE-family HTH domain